MAPPMDPPWTPHGQGPEQRKKLATKGLDVGGFYRGAGGGGQGMKGGTLFGFGKTVTPELQRGALVASLMTLCVEGQGGEGGGCEGRAWGWKTIIT